MSTLVFLTLVVIVMTVLRRVAQASKQVNSRSDEQLPGHHSYQQVGPASAHSASAPESWHQAQVQNPAGRSAAPQSRQPLPRELVGELHSLLDRGQVIGAIALLARDQQMGVSEARQLVHQELSDRQDLQQAQPRPQRYGSLPAPPRQGRSQPAARRDDPPHRTAQAQQTQQAQQTPAYADQPTSHPTGSGDDRATTWTTSTDESGHDDAYDNHGDGYHGSAALSSSLFERNDD